MSDLRERVARAMLATETTNDWERLGVLGFRYGSQEEWLARADAAIEAAWCIPEGWVLGDLSAKGVLEEFGSSYSCSIWSKSDPALYVVGHGPTPPDAFASAIAKIGGAQ